MQHESEHVQVLLVARMAEAIHVTKTKVMNNNTVTEELKEFNVLNNKYWIPV